MNIKNVLSTNAHWQVNKHLSRVFGDLRAAVLLSELIDCYLFFEKENKLEEYNGDMYFYETSEKMEEKTTLSYREQKTVISILEKAEVIKTKRMGTPAKLYFSVCEDKIWKLLNSNFDKNANQELTKTQIKNLSFVKTRIDKNANQDVAKTQNIYNKENNIKKINKENNIFLEKKINSDHSLDVGKMVNNENYRFADVGNTINNEGYRPKAEEKNYPPISAAPPIKKEEKNENDFKAVFLADNCSDNTNTLGEGKEVKNEKENTLKTNAYNCPTDFEGLWGLYQVGNKDISSRVFHKTLSLVEKEKVFDHVKRYVEVTPVEYRKNLQSYLKEKHYNDLIIDRRGSNKIAPKELPKTNINPEFEEIKKWHKEAEQRKNK